MACIWSVDLILQSILSESPTKHLALTCKKFDIETSPRSVFIFKVSSLKGILGIQHADFGVFY